MKNDIFPRKISRKASLRAKGETMSLRPKAIYVTVHGHERNRKSTILPPKTPTNLNQKNQTTKKKKIQNPSPGWVRVSTSWFAAPVGMRLAPFPTRFPGIANGTPNRHKSWDTRHVGVWSCPCGLLSWRARAVMAVRSAVWAGVGPLLRPLVSGCWERARATLARLQVSAQSCTRSLPNRVPWAVLDRVTNRFDVWVSSFF